MTGLTAKAIRARNWLKEYGLYEVRLFDDLQWRIFKDGQIQALGLGDDSLIKFAEDRGWQDHVPDAGNMVDEQEADGVVWKLVVESCMVGKFSITVGARVKGFEWCVWVDPLTLIADGTAPTRTEARASAIEAARGMG